MTTNNSLKSIRNLFLAGLSVALLATHIYAQAGDVAVVVNPANAVSDLKLGELKKIFAGEARSWPGGARVKLFVRAPGAHERDALLKLLNMSDHDYKQYWAAKVFRGDAQAEPVVLFSNGMQKEALGLYQGAIALVSIQDLKPGMKVVKIDGRSPGSPGYPLN